ncbi:hypothetical protein SAMN04487825_11481 [Prevotella sp. kh1p2]|nr:hypothetical protein SAMN04487825_11481 [Prevotella sp. kh1p2]SNU11814.1 hypothetical protein SAMN06298210_11424 [Prevotellaceae bacterium KH2P17]
MGVQIFVTTHNYVFLKELELAMTSKNDICFYSMYKIANDIHCHTAKKLDELEPNLIDETYNDLLDRQIVKDF